MTKKEFKQFLNEFIIPLFTGSTIGDDDTESQTYDNTVAFDDGNLSILIKPQKSDTYRIKVRRPQEFSTEDKKILESIISELTDYETFPDKYKAEAASLVIENAIANYLGDGNSDISLTIKKILVKLKKWANRTYEGRDVSFGIEINISNDSNDDITIEKFFENDFSALLSDGIETIIEISQKGSIIKLKGTNAGDLDIEECSKIPYRFIEISKALAINNIGIILLRNKELLIFRNCELIFAFRRGSWRHFNHDAIMKRIAGGSKFTNKFIRKAIYETCLDVSFSRTGGSITYLRKTYASNCIEDRIDKGDICNKKQY